MRKWTYARRGGPSLTTTRIREGLQALLRSSPEAIIVASASGWHSLLRVTEESDPDLVLLDVEQAGFGWVRAIQQIHKFAPDTVLACISSNGESDFIEEMSAAGAVTKAIAYLVDERILAFIRCLTDDQDIEVHSSPELGRQPFGPSPRANATSCAMWLGAH